MLIEEIMTRAPRCCHKDASASEAARIFWEHDCGCAPLVNGEGRLVGMITDRDICMAALFTNRPLTEIPLGDVVQFEAHSCKANQEVKEAEDIMRRAQVRRLPVVDEEQRVVGLLSLNDIALARKHDGRRRLPSEELADTLAAICDRTHHGCAA